MFDWGDSDDENQSQFNDYRFNQNDFDQEEYDYNVDSNHFENFDEDSNYNVTLVESSNFNSDSPKRDYSFMRSQTLNSKMNENYIPSQEYPSTSKFSNSENPKSMLRSVQEIRKKNNNFQN